MCSPNVFGPGVAIQAFFQVSAHELLSGVDFTRMSCDSGGMSEVENLLRQEDSSYYLQRKNGADMLHQVFSRTRVEIHLPQVCCVSRDKKM